MAEHAKALCEQMAQLRRAARSAALRDPSAYTRALCAVLQSFDRAWVVFEFDYVSTFVEVDTQVEFDDKQTVCVLFSETLMHALRDGLVRQGDVDDYEPALMFIIPRLAVFNTLTRFQGAFDFASDIACSAFFRPYRDSLCTAQSLIDQLTPALVTQLERRLAHFGSAGEHLDTSKGGEASADEEASAEDAVGSAVHALFTLTASIADQLQSSDRAKDLRYILKTIFFIHEVPI